eukprot:gene12294-16485_t
MTDYKRINDHNDQHYDPCDIYRKENMAILMSYLAVGVVSSFISTPLNVYLVETLEAEPQMQNTIAILQTLPWSLKLVFGFLSDAVPIYGMHRKPYLTMGCLLYSAAFIVYALVRSDNIAWLSFCTFTGTLGLIELDVMADTMCVQRSKFEPEDRKGQMQSSFYSIRFAGSLIGAILGAIICNKKTWGWGLDYFQVSFINGLIPFFLVTPWLFSLKEKFHHHEHHYHGQQNNQMEMMEAKKQLHKSETVIKSPKHENGYYNNGINNNNENNTDKVLLNNNSNNKSYGLNDNTQSLQQLENQLPEIDNSKNNINNNNKNENDDESDDFEVVIVDDTQGVFTQIHEIWETVQLKSVWRPMAFVYIFNMFQIPNVAWQSFLQLGLNFEPWILGLTVIIGTFMTFAGILAYKYFFFKASWRSIYIWSVCLTTFFALLQLMLIFQINKKYLHLSNYLFSLGDDVITAYISGIQFLPVCIMYMRLCPDGAEGTSYAMLTTFGNIALVCASNLGNQLASVWDVSNEAMIRHDYNGLWKLSVLTSCVSVIPLSLLFLLPKDAEEQDELSKTKERSKVAGAIFLFVLLGSLLWTSVTAIVRITT